MNGFKTLKICGWGWCTMQNPTPTLRLLCEAVDKIAQRMKGLLRTTFEDKIAICVIAFMLIYNGLCCI